MSIDNRLIGTHSFDNFENSEYLINNGILYDDFKKITLFNTYTPINEEWLFETLINYPDVKIIIDTKSDFMPIYNRLTKLSDEYNVNINSQIIPQLYDKEMWDIMSVQFNFNEYIFTNYKAEYSIDEILEYFSDPKITTVTMHISSIAKKNLWVWKLRKTKNVYMHTINTPFELLLGKLFGCNGFYVDYVKYI